MKSTIQLGNISVEASDTDAVLLKKAKKHLPHALEYFGEGIAKEEWNIREKSFRNLPIKLNSSISNKAKFIRDRTAEFTKKATATYKKNVTNYIFEQLQKQRNIKADK